MSKKRAMSLLLALVLCLGLAVPALAAEAKAGDTTVTDANGVTYQLSKPIVRVDPKPEDIPGNFDTVYVVSKGTVIVPVRAEGYQLIEADGFIQFQKSASDRITIWSTTIFQGLGNSNNAGLTIEKYDSDRYTRYIGFMSQKADNVYTIFTCAEPDAEEPAQPSVPAIVSTGLDPEATGTAHPSTQNVLVDGKTAEFQYYKLTDADGGETNYVKLRDLADILDGTAAQFNVTWSEADGVGLQTKTAYLSRNGSEGKTPYAGDRSYRKGADTTLVNGTAVPLQAFILTDDNGGDYTYYKLRDLAQALDFNVGWDEARGVFIETDKPYDPSN